MMVPVIGYFARDGEMVEARPWHLDQHEIIHHYPFSVYTKGRKLADLGFEALDYMLANGDGELREYLGAKWLLLKGYVRIVAQRRERPGFYVWVYELTDAGRAFHRAIAAPEGEW